MVNPWEWRQHVPSKCLEPFTRQMRHHIRDNQHPQYTILHSRRPQSSHLPETCRAKNILIKLPCCIKLAFQIISLGRCTVKQPSTRQIYSWYCNQTIIHPFYLAMGYRTVYMKFEQVHILLHAHVSTSPQYNLTWFPPTVTMKTPKLHTYWCLADVTIGAEKHGLEYSLLPCVPPGQPC